MDDIGARILGLWPCGVFTEIKMWEDAVSCSEDTRWRR